MFDSNIYHLKSNEVLSDSQISSLVQKERLDSDFVGVYTKYQDQRFLRTLPNLCTEKFAYNLSWDTTVSAMGFLRNLGNLSSVLEKRLNIQDNGRKTTVVYRANGQDSISFDFTHDNLSEQVRSNGVAQSNFTFGMIQVSNSDFSIDYLAMSKLKRISFYSSIPISEEIVELIQRSSVFDFQASGLQEILEHTQHFLERVYFSGEQ